MKKVTLVAFVVAQVFALSAFAQDSKPRAEVKAEAAAANKAGTIEKGDASDTAKPAKITKMTKEEKAAARAISSNNILRQLRVRACGRAKGQR